MWTAATVCGAAGGTPGPCTSPWRTMSGSRWTWSMSMTTSTSRQRRETAHCSLRRSGECSLDQLSPWQGCMISCQELFTDSVHWNLLLLSSSLNVLKDFKFSPVFVNIASANGVHVSHVDRQWLDDPSNTEQVNSLQGIQLRGGSHVSANLEGSTVNWL